MTSCRIFSKAFSSGCFFSQKRNGGGIGDEDADGMMGYVQPIHKISTHVAMEITYMLSLKEEDSVKIFANTNKDVFNRLAVT